MLIFESQSQDLEIKVKKLFRLLRKVVLLLSFFPLVAIADQYEVNFRAAEFSNHDNIVIITNVSSLKSIEIDMAEVFNPGLVVDVNNQRYDYSVFAPLATDLGLTYSNGTPTNYPKVIDIQGTDIVFQRLQGALRVHRPNGQNFDYGRKLTYSSELEEVTSDVLIAYSQEAFDYAFSKLDELREYSGRNVSIILATGESFPEASHTNGYSFISFSNSILSDGLISTRGGLFSESMLDNDGNSIVRKESDGSIHLGQNSVRIFDSEIHPTGNDVIDSSINRLQLGSNPAHRTIIEGTLEVPEPTATNHAASKGYVDRQVGGLTNYIDSSVAMSMAMSALPKAHGDDSFMGFAVGHHGGQSAIALGISRNIAAKNLQVNANIGYTQRTKTSAAVGVGWKF
jgi:autotransporter adhesin